MNLDSYISSQAVGKRSFTDRIKCPECDGLQWTWIDEVAAMCPYCGGTGNISCSDLIHVIDIETTGLDPTDLVIEVAVATINTSTGSVRPANSRVVGYDTDTWPPSWRNAWIFSNSDLKINDVYYGEPQASVGYALCRIIGNQPVTSYNTDFDLGHLMRPPWSLDRLIRKPDIMTACDGIVKGRRNKESKHPTLMISYAELCPGDPAKLCGAQQHRALSDAMAAAHVLRELIDRGAYPEVMP